MFLTGDLGVDGSVGGGRFGVGDRGGGGDEADDGDHGGVGGGGGGAFFSGVDSVRPLRAGTEVAAASWQGTEAVAETDELRASDKALKPSLGSMLA